MSDSSPAQTPNEERLAKRLARAKAEIAGLEEIIETKARDLFLSRERLRQSMRFQENVLSTMASALLVLDPDGQVTQANPAASATLGFAPGELIGVPFARLTERGAALPTLGEHQEVELKRKDGTIVPAHFSGTAMTDEAHEVEAFVCVWLDLSDQRQLEIELRHAQKLESLGQMAAGVAHEINTPIQFVGDSLCFLREAFEDLRAVLHAYQAGKTQWMALPQFAALAQELESAEENADIEFVEEEAPGAFERATHGLARVATIVKALKSFSHPGGEEAAPTDLNQVLANTLTLAHNEYKYVAELHTDLGELPAIPCHAGDMGQVFLNLIVNAAHAIEAKVQGTGTTGTIRLRSYVQEGFAVFEVQDSGTGIPKEIVDRIYDPFFTTKEVGKGTGQGLAITRRIIVEKHGGRIDLESEAGEGTTFRLWLPLAAEVVAPPKSSAA